jgi:hypothetical protein
LERPKIYCSGKQGGNFTIPVSTFRVLRKMFEQPVKVRASHFTRCFRFFKT